VADDNDYYTTQDGVLYNKDTTTLILYPNAKADKSFTVPETVITIGGYAFEDCSALRSVEMLNGLKTIKYEAFWDCSSLETVVIPATTESIETYAFHGCESLATIRSYVQEPTEISSSAFKIDDDTYTTATLYVPAGTVEKYRNTVGWNKIENIVEMDE